MDFIDVVFNPGWPLPSGSASAKIASVEDLWATAAINNQVSAAAVSRYVVMCILFVVRTKGDGSGHNLLGLVTYRLY